MNKLVVVKNLVKLFGSVRAVDGVSFEIAPGETLAVVGESGSGKSTLGRCVLRLTEPTSGEVRFADRDVLRLGRRALRELRCRMQPVCQDQLASLNPRMTVDQAIAEPIKVHRLCPRAMVAGRVRELLRRVGLPEEVADRYPYELSGGQRQRVVIARALAPGPQFIVADEPVSALDVNVQAQVINLFRDLQDQQGLGYLMILHSLALVRHLAHHVAVMKEGRIVELGPTLQVLEEPQHPHTRALLEAARHLESGWVRLFRSAK